MANKKTIQDVDRKLDELHRDLTRTVNAINKQRVLRKKIILGKVKRVPPPGVKVKIASNPEGLCAAELNDLLPSFGP